jgi:voltage-gated sodium channel
VKHLRSYFTTDRYVAGVILFNAVIIFLLAFDEINQYPILKFWMGLLDTLFILYFLLEAVFKIQMHGWKLYITDTWNKFDFIIVILSIPSILLLFESAMKDLSFVFVLRVVRVIRFFKFIKFIPNVENLFAGVARAFRASVFVLATFFIYTFIVSLISCKLFKDVSPEAAKYFGDPIISFYSIFKIFTIEGWYDIPESILQENNPVFNFFTILYFIMVVVSGGLFGLSIVNAIFVDEMVKDNQDDLLLKIEEIDRKLEKLLSEKYTDVEARQRIFVDFSQLTNNKYGIQEDKKSSDKTE